MALRRVVDCNGMEKRPWEFIYFSFFLPLLFSAHIELIELCTREVIGAGGTYLLQFADVVGGEGVASCRFRQKGSGSFRMETLK